MLMQVVRYGVVGVANNFLGYLIYLLVTWLWLDPKVAVSLFYPLAATMGYFSHAKFSFSHNGRHRDAIPRYIVAHVVGYLTNIILLYVFVDVLLYPHQLVQIMAMIIVAGELFLLFRYYVFPDKCIKD
jgi:putative flippase GtrA